MINFNKKNVNFISIIISIIIFSIVILFIDNSKIEEASQLNENKITKNLETEIPNIWKIQIDSLKLEGNIKQINSYKPEEDSIGHIKETTISGNNIGLIAYNYGKKQNYFANLKELNVGEEIIYTVNEQKRLYKVISNKIIDEKSLKNILKVNNEYESYLKLFTYVKDLNNKLRYVCAKEIIDI